MLIINAKCIRVLSRVETGIPFTRRVYRISNAIHRSHRHPRAPYILELCAFSLVNIFAFFLASQGPFATFASCLTLLKLVNCAFCELFACTPHLKCGVQVSFSLRPLGRSSRWATPILHNERQRVLHSALRAVFTTSATSSSCQNLPAPGYHPSAMGLCRPALRAPTGRQLTV